MPGFLGRWAARTLPAGCMYRQQQIFALGSYVIQCEIVSN